MVQIDVCQLRQVVEKRIAGVGEKDFVARVRKEFEEVEVTFAGAGGEEDVVGRDGGGDGMS